MVSISIHWIFILLSIKTRIETSHSYSVFWIKKLFLSYYPLKQGLKRIKHINYSVLNPKFLSYYPLKQGLKRVEGDVR